MDPKKNELKDAREKEISRREQLREYWRRRMSALREKKLSRGAANLYRMIKSRFKWGNKDVNRDDKKSHHKS